MALVNHTITSLLRLTTLCIVLMFSVFALSSEPVDVNTADVETLSTLKNVGKKKAQAIVTYRESNGKFSSVDDLVKVKGIGNDTLNANRENMVASQ